MNKFEKICWKVNRREKRWDIWRQKKDISHQIPRDHKIGSVVDKK